MASQQRTVEYLLEQASGTGALSTKPTFGDYGVYIDGKMIGLICDDHLFLKLTQPLKIQPEVYDIRYQSEVHPLFGPVGARQKAGKLSESMAQASRQGHQV